MLRKSRAKFYIHALAASVLGVATLLKYCQKTIPSHRYFGVRIFWFNDALSWYPLCQDVFPELCETPNVLLVFTDLLKVW